MTNTEEVYNKGFQDGMNAFVLLMQAYLSMSEEMQKALMIIVKGE